MYVLCAAYVQIVFGFGWIAYGFCTDDAWPGHGYVRTVYKI